MVIVELGLKTLFQQWDVGALSLHTWKVGQRVSNSEECMYALTQCVCVCVCSCVLCACMCACARKCACVMCSPYVHAMPFTICESITASLHASMNICIHVYMHTCIHAYIHTCIKHPRPGNCSKELFIRFELIILSTL